MAENSKIEWTDHTFNPWIGCTKVSPGCAHCYAETQDKFRSWTPEGWGKGRPRRRTSLGLWKQPFYWNASGNICAECGKGCHGDRCMHGQCKGATRRPRVFCASLADWLDDEVPIEWLADLLALIHATPHLDWLLLSKRPQNWERRILASGPHIALGAREAMLAWIGRGVAPPNVWIGTSVEDQTRADERIPELLKIPAPVRFLSCEPLLGPVDLTAMRLDPEDPLFHYWPLTGEHIRDGMNEPARLPDAQRIHWVIAGGESGPHARPIHPEWVRSLRDQCAASGVAFHFKQWGEAMPHHDAHTQGKIGPVNHPWGLCQPGMARVGKKLAGRTLDGRLHDDFPTL